MVRARSRRRRVPTGSCRSPPGAHRAHWPPLTRCAVLRRPGQPHGRRLEAERLRDRDGRRRPRERILTINVAGTINPASATNDRRRRSPRRDRSSAILDSLEAPPELVTSATSNTVIVPAQGALSADGEASQRIKSSVDRGLRHRSVSRTSRTPSPAGTTPSWSPRGSASAVARRQRPITATGQGSHPSATPATTRHPAGGADSTGRPGSPSPERSALHAARVATGFAERGTNSSHTSARA